MDSAGIGIVVSHRPQWTEAERWRISAEPTARIGGAEDRSAVLFGVSAMAMLRNGTVVIANRGELLFFSLAGDAIAGVRRDGSGPGEYRHASTLLPSMDGGVALYDSRLRRLVRFDSIGQHIRDIAVEGRTVDSRPIGQLSDGGLLFFESEWDTAAPPPRADVLPTKVSWVRHGPDGTRGEVLASMPGHEMHTASAGHNLVPLGPEAVGAVGGDRIWLGHGATYELREYTHDGTLVRILRNSKPRIPVTEEDTEAYVEALVRVQRSENIASVRRMMEDVPWPEAYPAFTNVLTDDAGRLWVCEGTRFRTSRGRESCWSVYDRDGVQLGRVEVPADMLVWQVTSDRVLGLRFDAGVPEVVVHDIERGSGT